MTATTFETFDLLEGFGERDSSRESTRSPGPGPKLVRQIDTRAVRRYVYVNPTASNVELRRLSDLWFLTAQGTLPMLWNHAKDGNVAVTFDEPDLTWLQESFASGALRVRLREFLG